MKTKQPKITDDFLKSHAMEVFTTSKNARSFVEGDWRKSEDNYQGKFGAGEKTKSEILMGQYRLFIPKTFNTLQRMMADIMDALFFDPEEMVDVRNAEKPQAVKNTIKALLTWRINVHPIDFYRESYEAVEDGLKHGVGIFKVYPKLKWTEKKEVVAENVEEGGEVKDAMEEPPRKKEIVIEAFEPRIECVPPEDVFFDANATWKDYWKYPIVHRMLKTKDELREAGYKNVDDAPTVDSPSLTQDMLKERRASSPGGSPFSGAETQPLIKRTYLYELWTFLDLGEGLTSVVCKFLGDAGGPSVVAAEPEENELPYKYSEFEPPMAPFVVGTPIPAAHRQYGYMLPVVTDALQKETNILRNQDREAAALAIRKPILYRRDAGLDVMGLINRKIGANVAGDDIGADAVRELQTSNPIVNTAPVAQRNDQDYYEATSITPGQMGISQRDETATAVSSHQMNANKKIQLIVKNLVQTLIRPAFWMLGRLEQAYETEGVIRSVTGQALGWGTPNDGAPAWGQIQGDFDFVVDVGVNKGAQLNKFMLIMDRINQTNVATMQLLQSGALSPEDAKFMNPAWAFGQIMSTLKVRGADAMIPAKAPAPAAEVTTPGSQPRNIENPNQAAGQMNPEMINDIFS